MNTKEIVYKVYNNPDYPKYMLRGKLTKEISRVVFDIQAWYLELETTHHDVPLTENITLPDDTCSWWLDLPEFKGDTTTKNWDEVICLIPVEGTKQYQWPPIHISMEEFEESKGDGGDDYLDAYGISCKKYLQGIRSGDIEPTPEIVSLILSGYSAEELSLILMGEL